MSMTDPIKTEIKDKQFCPQFSARRVTKSYGKSPINSVNEV